MHQWDKLVDHFLYECAARHLSPAFILSRRRELDRWGMWLKRRRPRPTIEQVSEDPDYVVKYLQSRAVGRSKQTLASAISHMRMMGEYLVQTNVWVSNPLRWMKGPKLSPHNRIPRTVSKRQMQRLWQEAEANHFHMPRYRMLAMLGVFYGTGIRRGELARLKLADWDRDSGILRVDGRKTNAERQMPVPELTWRLLEAWMPVRQNHLARHGLEHEDALFISKDGCELKAEAITQSFSSLVRRAGIEGVSLHGLRHSCATDLLEAGADVPQIKALMGHSCIQTTVRYLNMTGSFRHEAVKQHPINQILSIQTAGGAS